MSEFIRTKQQELKERLREIDKALTGWEDLQAERSRIVAALEALGESAVDRSRRDGRASRGPTKLNRRRRTGVSESIIKLVSERPGVSASEIASKLDVNAIHSRLAPLVKSGKIERFDLPSGSKGYRIPSAGRD